MYLHQIRLRNIRCFKDEFCIDLPARPDDSQNWTIILGDNGTGKSTLLRCIALGLCDETSASGLLRELSGEWVRHGEKEGEITLTLRSSSRPNERFETHTLIHRKRSGNEELEQKTIPEKDFPWREVFACGYGAAYGTLGSEVYEKYRLIDSVYSLFNYEARLQNPENALFRIARAGTDIDLLLDSINRILMLPPHSIRLDSSGLQINSPFGRVVPAGSIGDGYAATMAWISDLFGWTLLAKQGPFDINMKGLVLHDEIEQHLHPLWQRKIIGLLGHEFPALQFFATTHAPLIAIGAAALSNDRCQLILLEQNDDCVSVRTGLRPSGRSAGRVEEMDSLCALLDDRAGQYDAVAISSVIDVPHEFHQGYFDGGGDMVNPWGGVEAMLTHALSSLYNVPTAHSPMFESREIANADPGIVDPRMAAEAVSTTFLQCTLKGLQRSPRIVTDPDGMNQSGVFTAADVSCLVMPDGCLGLPTLAALEQGIPVVAVQENQNLMKNDLSALPWAPGQFHRVANYWEAVGVIAAMRAGIDPLSVRRPLAQTVVSRFDASSAEPESEVLGVASS